MLTPFNGLLIPGRIPGGSRQTWVSMCPPQSSSSKHDRESALAMPDPFISFLTTSNQVYLDPPLDLVPSTSINTVFLTQSFYSFLFIQPNHFNLFLFRTILFFLPLLFATLLPSSRIFCLYIDVSPLRLTKGLLKPLLTSLLLELCFATLYTVYSSLLLSSAVSCHLLKQIRFFSNSFSTSSLHHYVPLCPGGPFVLPQTSSVTLSRIILIDSHLSFTPTAPVTCPCR